MPFINLRDPVQEAYKQLDGREQRLSRQEQELADARQAAQVGRWCCRLCLSGFACYPMRCLCPGTYG